MISKRRSYRLANRKAKHEYNNEMNKKKHYIIWLQIVPNPLGEKFKQNQSQRSKSSTISHDQFFKHFENIYLNCDGFSSADVEEDISSIFSKIVSILLDNRLRVWSESNHLLSDVQFGFRKSKSTVDCIFVLSSIIDKVINYE